MIIIISTGKFEKLPMRFEYIHQRFKFDRYDTDGSKDLLVLMCSIEIEIDTTN